MVIYNESMTMRKEVKWKFGGKCDVSSQHQTECFECKEAKLCWAIPTDEEMGYICEECISQYTDTATVNVEKAYGN